MLLIKVSSSEWCDVDVYEVIDGVGLHGFEVEGRDIREFKYLGTEVSEKVGLSSDFTKCLKGYGADIVMILECEFDYPHVVLVYLREKKVVHFFCTAERRGLREKIGKYRRRGYVIKLE